MRAVVRSNKFLKLKIKAVKLRRSGQSIREIETLLGVSRSTLSAWLKDIQLTKSQIKKLRLNWSFGLVKARQKAIIYHKEKKLIRLEAAKRAAELSVSALNLKDIYVLKLALAMLFAGEGFKVADETSLGNSDVMIVKSFVKMLDSVYGLNMDKLRIYLHLRADQNIQNELKYWSNVLEIDLKYFKIAAVDKRTIGKQTYIGYHGVCAVRYYDVSIKRELLEIANNFFEKLTS